MGRSWRVGALLPEAKAISVSRRTDVPAFFTSWFLQRLEEGFAEYLPPRSGRKRISLAPEMVTHIDVWTKWPKPFTRALDRLQELGYPVLFNVTLTGLGGTPVEPRVPAPPRVLEAIQELSERLSPTAIQWRFDPIFVSERYPVERHLRMFGELAGALGGHVDRVATSFIERYSQQVEPDLRAYEVASGDRLLSLSEAEKLDLLARMQEIAAAAGIPLVLCCQPDLQRASGLPRSGCNSWAWALRAYPELQAFRRLRARATRKGCACSEETDIGFYDTCPFGCRYCYASRNHDVARTRQRRHDPSAPAILPAT